MPSSTTITSHHHTAELELFIMQVNHNLIFITILLHTRYVWICFFFGLTSHGVNRPEKTTNHSQTVARNQFWLLALHAKSKLANFLRLLRFDSCDENKKKIACHDRCQTFSAPVEHQLASIVFVSQARGVQICIFTCSNYRKLYLTYIFIFA